MRIYKATMTALLAIAVASCASPSQRPTVDSLTFKPISTQLPKTRKVVMDNGIVVLLLADRELPLVNVSAMIKTGAIWEPGGKEGLAALTGSVMRSGGTLGMPPSALDEALEFRAISVETGIGDDSGSASLSTLSKDLDEGLGYLADVMIRPRFDAGRFDLAKAAMLDGIRRENDEPAGAASRELGKLVYQGSPYGRVPTLESVSSITREDLIAFHRKYFSPKSVILGVTGDFDEEEMLQKLNEVFGGWDSPAPDFPSFPPPEEPSESLVYVADKDLKQSVIRAGHLSLLRTDPDYHAIRVMDNILGGAGFASRMLRKVRTERGLAYSVWSYTLGGYWEKGRFTMGAETKTSSTREALGLMVEEIKKIREEPVSAEELEGAKNSIVNSFVFIFDRPAKIMGQRMNVEYYGLPDDYLESYRDKVMAVTVEDVHRVAEKWLRPDRMIFMVIGKIEGFDGPLDGFGQVRNLVLRDYSAMDGGR